MTEKRTVKFDDDARSKVTVQTIEVSVTDGPDEGVSLVTDTEVLTVGSAKGNDLVLSDPTVSRYHVELQLSDDGIVVRDNSSTNGTFIGALRVHDAVFPPGTALRIGRTTLRVGAGKSVDIELLPEERLGHLLGRSESMRRLMMQVRKVARTEAPTLIVGESGTGKELIASAIHDLGPRTKGPFVTVDCGAMSPNLVASELFGHERGAFTGADRQHIGAFERAHGGTIFLDEIGELPAELQPNLLGALERKRFRRVGGRTDIDVDVRIVAATNRDLRAEVNAGRFRLDLYYRLAIVTLRVAPLRERYDDLPLLVEHFLRECGHEGAVEEVFDEALMATLGAYRWPGNVRELRNLVEATLAMGEAYLPESLEPLGSDEEVSATRPTFMGDGLHLDLRPSLDLAYKDARAMVLDQFEKHYLAHWLEKSEGNVAKAAREAKMDRSHLFHLLRRHDLR
ncbi:MAG: sigma 54-interacting transcriptional regulator [Polyangiales bacterium]|nr:sigma 54-dependent Fis family transcriptional regulator [Myxococcales bacterium]MCB9659493.1 sigma 54-dependent Fis family transcriptional regulator [Sandaracinaceae bacterium]